MHRFVCVGEDIPEEGILKYIALYIIYINI